MTNIYNVITITSDRNFAGTSADVFIELIGTKEFTGKRHQNLLNF